jgi:hypothetical protein
MANLEQKRFASMVRMLQTAYPKHWGLHLRNLGVAASANTPPADLDQIMERVFWMVPQVGIKDPAAWIAFDIGRAEADSVSVEHEAPPKIAVRHNSVELEPVKLGTDLPATFGASSPSSEIASASVRPLRRDPVELKPVRREMDLAKTSGASPPASETVIKEPANRTACDMAPVKASSASVEPKAPVKVELPLAVRQNPAGLAPVQRKVDLAKTSGASLLELETAIVVAQQLSWAKLRIAGGKPREAADAMFTAHEYGASQQNIAAAVGKSQGWVSCMIRWRREMFKDDTPFGPASKDARLAARIGRRIGPMPRGMLRSWMRRTRRRIAAGTKDDGHASGVLVIKGIQPECPELPAADIEGAKNNASGRPSDGAK